MSERENSEKRKQQSLSNSEWLTFFLLPFMRKGFDPTSLDTFNEGEEKRFRKFGFDNKLKESVSARKWGIVFYLSLTILIACFVKYYK